MITIMDVTKYLVGIYCDQAWQLLWEEREREREVVCG